MKTPHVHAELIKAWADGAEIEYYRYCTQVWTLMEAPAWGIDTVYRIKPEPAKDFLVYQYVAPMFRNGSISTSHGRMNDHNLQMTFDGETGALKSAQVLT